MVDVFVVEVPRAELELASDRLWRLGVRGIEERDVRPGFVELRTTVGASPSSVARAAATLESNWPWRVEEIDERWEGSWRAMAAPVVVSRTLVVAPAWCSDDTARSAPDLDADAVVVWIEPRDSFGLGDHPTTRLTLQALEELIVPGASVLDVGCGSGVLSIAARQLGAGTVRAIDVSAAAVEVARENAERNCVDGIDVATTPVSDVEPAADIVLANVLAPELVAMAGDLRRLTRSRLVVSGVLADRHQHVVDALAPMRVVRTRTAEGWAAVTLAAS